MNLENTLKLISDVRNNHLEPEKDPLIAKELIDLYDEAQGLFFAHLKEIKQHYSLAGESLKTELSTLLQNENFDMVANSFDMASLEKNVQLFITLQNNIIKDLHAFASKLIDQAAGSDSKSPL